MDCGILLESHFCPGWVHSERECKGIPLAMACDMKYSGFARCLHILAHRVS